jgi:hypothetical protein
MHMPPEPLEPTGNPLPLEVTGMPVELDAMLLACATLALEELALLELELALALEFELELVEPPEPLALDDDLPLPLEPLLALEVEPPCPAAPSVSVVSNTPSAPPVAQLMTNPSPTRNDTDAAHVSRVMASLLPRVLAPALAPRLGTKDTLFFPGIQWGRK